MRLTSLPGKIVALQAISNGALRGGALPTRLKLLQAGRNDSVIGPVLVDTAAAQTFAANQKALGFERVALDFEHNTVPGSPEFERTKEPRAIAAQGTPRIAADGLWLDEVTWLNSDGARCYEDLSPAVSLDDQGRVTFMHSAALTRNGAVYGLTFFSAGGRAAAGPRGRDRMAAGFARQNAQPFDLATRTYSAPASGKTVELLPLEGLRGRDLMIASAENNLRLLAASDVICARTVNGVTRLAAASAQGDAESEVAARQGKLADQAVIDPARIPNEVKVLPFGDFLGTPYQRFSVNQDTANLLAQNQAAFNLARVPILLPEIVKEGQRGQDDVTLASAAVAATGIPIVRVGDGLWLTDLQWTDAGRNGLLQYSGLVPNVWFDDARTVIGIRSATLSTGDSIVAQQWPRFLKMSVASQQPHGYSRMVAGFERQNAARQTPLKWLGMPKPSNARPESLHAAKKLRKMFAEDGAVEETP